MQPSVGGAPLNWGAGVLGAVWLGCILELGAGVFGSIKLYPSVQVSFTVAILAQGTPRGDATSQPFFVYAQYRFPSVHHPL